MPSMSTLMLIGRVMTSGNEASRAMSGSRMVREWLLATWYAFALPRSMISSTRQRIMVTGTLPVREGTTLLAVSSRW